MSDLTEFAVTQEELNEFLTDKFGESLKCPFCGNNRFSILVRLDDNYMSDISILKLNNDEGAPRVGGLLTIPYACSNCGNVYSISVTHLLEWRESKNEKEK